MSKDSGIVHALVATLFMLLGVQLWQPIGNIFLQWSFSLLKMAGCYLINRIFCQGIIFSFNLEKRSKL